MPVDHSVSGPTEPVTPRVLLVDDHPDNLLALRAVLEPLDLEIVCARSGADALLALLESEFALVILDVQMPGMDGFETARVIKGRERTRLLPIVFLTALSDAPEHHLTGYRSGAVDYVAKPVDPEILRAKVLVFVELWSRGHVIEAQRAALAAQLEAVDRLNEELERANATLDAFAARAAEDLLEPLDDLAGFLELLDAQHGGELGEVGNQLIERSLALAGSQRARVASLLESSQAVDAQVELGPVDLRRALAEARRRTSEGPGVVGVDDEAVTTVCADRTSLVRVLELLLRRAGRAGAERVALTATEDGPWVVLRVTDDGATPSSDHLASMFSTHDRDPTFDNTVCRRLVERHGGAIWAEPHEPRGASVLLTLPAWRDR